jgi:glycosyltransferase involved in cell wall biosynthesis
MSPHKVRLLLFTGASGYEDSGSVWLGDENLRRWAGLSSSFDVMALAVRVSAAKHHTALLPSDMTMTWLPLSFHTGLAPRHLSSLWKRIREADAFVTLMPEIRGIVPLLIAAIARRPRYMLMQATSSHFRASNADGRLRASISRFVINCLGLVSTKVFIQGPDLRSEFIGPLRKKCVEVLMSTLTEADFQEPKRPDPGAVRLLTVARLVPNKRVDVVLKTVRVLKDRGADARLTLLGGGPLREELLNLVQELDIENEFESVGFVDAPELRKLYGSATLFVLSSETEGVSLAVMEAMAAGTPVVATAPGGMRTFLRHGVDSVVIHGPDPEAFADEIEEIIADPDRYLRIARAAQEKVMPYSTEAWARSIERVIRQDLERSVGSGSPAPP